MDLFISCKAGSSGLLARASVRMQIRTLTVKPPPPPEPPPPPNFLDLLDETNLVGLLRLRPARLPPFLCYLQLPVSFSVQSAKRTSELPSSFFSSTCFSPLPSSVFRYLWILRFLLSLPLFDARGQRFTSGVGWWFRSVQNMLISGFRQLSELCSSLDFGSMVVRWVGTLLPCLLVRGQLQIGIFVFPPHLLVSDSLTVIRLYHLPAAYLNRCILHLAFAFWPSKSPCLPPQSATCYSKLQGILSSAPHTRDALIFITLRRVHAGASSELQTTLWPTRAISRRLQPLSKFFIAGPCPLLSGIYSPNFLRSEFPLGFFRRGNTSAEESDSSKGTFFGLSSIYSMLGMTHLLVTSMLLDIISETWLGYIEIFPSSSPRGEQPLPPWSLFGFASTFSGERSLILLSQW